MALTEVAIRNAKPKDKPYKLGDAGGLFLYVTPAGGKLWRVKFRVNGKEKLLSLGAWPEISLANARKERDKAKEALATGIDPARDKQQAKHRAKVAAANTFAEIGAEYLDKRKREGLSESTSGKADYYLSRLTPALGRLPIGEITASDVLAVLRTFEKQGKHETANRLLQLASRIFRYAVATARLTSDPTRDLRGAITTPKVTHYGAITDAEGAGKLLRAIDGYEGGGITRLAMQIAPHVFVRPGELRHAEWGEIDLEGALWIIPAEKMKMRKAHHVPLSRQAVDLFKEVRRVTGPAGYVFPSVRTRARPMSENTINAGLRRLGYSSDEMTAHGFRSMASTLLNESGKWSPDAIERALAHADTDSVRAAYHRGAHWKERVEMAQWWSDYLDTLRKGAEVVPFPDRAAG
ncbi:tyrosine-type recombinase/integrase [Novosphingobium humi]|uniref:tyrosine-type recombinase/integrase n=1 Tax=Novosphingobium humi TaxID=2282397 RepID=UPI0025B23CE2|nr:integrase arm-type DNA-binding domain-containing protein [Novosphingobium humi]WJS98369.1 tyrosine-type recombinase/integrase [Novosphingobium humi]